MQLPRQSAKKARRAERQEQNSCSPPSCSSNEHSLLKRLATSFLVSLPLLLAPMTVPLSHASNYDVLFSTVQDQNTGFAASLPSKRALQQLRNEQDLQNARLLQCEDSGPDQFEQCFFYGTTGISQAINIGTSRNQEPPVVVPSTRAPLRGIMPPAASNSKITKGGIPTW
ncbi:expressed unknown protein [Seminavis robusta]|uniref:Uncharacterized protein n=1 Tax=Seminavis robusta TaxID=568900 RepID=A0A9N8ECV0_9STRA|nr:expressed unknown protein [Seminavis robusta]|eukprot:Sro904_g218340.1 n/a (170) ;mRNA; r:4185-4694